MNQTDHDLDFLKKIFEDKPIKCESPHQNTGCSGEVAYLVDTTCDLFAEPRRVCRLSVEHPEKGTLARMLKGRVCAGCFNGALTCWVVRPI